MKGVKIDFNFVPMPSEIWDEGIELSLSEFRLLGYLIRRQVRFGVAVVAFTRDDLMNGPMRNGGRLDAGCKLSKNSLNSAIESLLARRWIQVEDASNHPKLSQLRISVVMSKLDSDRQSLTIESSDVDDSLTRVERARKEKRLPSTSQKAVATTSIPAWLDADTWAAFCEMRKSIKHPMTSHAEKLMLAKLERFAAQGISAKGLLERSIVNNWRDVFPEQGNFRGAPASVKLVETEFKL